MSPSLFYTCAVVFGASFLQDSTAPPEPPADAGLVEATIVDGRIELNWIRQPNMRGPWGNYLKPGVSVRDMGLPGPITTIDLDRWAWTLRLSDAQRQYWAEAYTGYRDAELRAHEEHVQPVWDQAEAMGPESPYKNVETAQVWKRLMMEERPRALKKLDAIESAFFRELEPSLADSQRHRLELVRTERRRTRLYDGTSWYPGGSTDVTLILHELHTAGYDLAPTHSVQFEDALFQYARTVTPLFLRRQMIKARNSANAALYFASGERERRLPEAAQGMRIEQAIAEANTRFVAALSRLLPSETAAELDRRYRRAVYPIVYPDDSDIGKMFDTLLSAELSDDLREQISVFRNAYARSQRGICEQMEQRYTQWQEGIGYMRQEGSDASEKYSADMWELHAKRVTNGRYACQVVRELLVEAGVAELAAIDVYQSQLDNALFDPRQPLLRTPDGRVIQPGTTVVPAD